MKETTKTAKSKLKANKAYEQKNKEKKQYWNKRSATRSFLREYATRDDLKEVKDLIKKRELFLEDEEKKEK
ncbi:hypothetical protein [Carnobacterium sp. FSL E2-0243]|uniref:hypothetical protein n=1 Tax=Carnobacterium sp. FSL E2-0243 TaxID=2921365 RepID=UPI0030F677DC